MAAQAGEPTRLTDDFLGNGQKLKFDALFFGLFDFFFVGRHFMPCAAVGQHDLLGTQAQAGACGVDGHVAAADDNHLFAGHFPVP
mgnify:CR=1 FL=1